MMIFEDMEIESYNALDGFIQQITICDVFYETVEECTGNSGSVVYIALSYKRMRASHSPRYISKTINHTKK